MSSPSQMQVFQVKGMTCGHCKAAVESAIQSVKGVQRAHVDREAGQAVVEGVFASEAVVESIKDAGYDAIVSAGK